MVGQVSDPSEEEIRRFRTIWISDIHLGTPGCKAEFLVEFLRHHESDTLYLVGDIIDGWRIKRSWYWNQAHNDVIQKVMRKARKGTDVILVPGNHDAFVRDYDELHFGGIEIRNETVHQTVDGRRFLVTHGDKYDGVIRYARWLAILGDRAYVSALKVNDWFNGARALLGYRYWSLSAWLKRKVKNAVEFVSRFEETLANEAREKGLDGVICGHIHTAEMKYFDEILYCNDGDWVESCTALVETEAGELRLIDWTVEREEFVTGHRPSKARPAAGPALGDAELVT